MMKIGIIVVGAIALAIFLLGAGGQHVNDDCNGGLHATVSELYARNHRPADVKLLQIWDDRSADLKRPNDAKLIVGCTAKAEDSRGRYIAITYGVEEKRGDRFYFAEWKVAAAAR